MSGQLVPTAVREAACIAATGIQMTEAVADLDRPACSKGLQRYDRRLLIRDEVLFLLHLSDEQVQQLINTRQLTPFFITGEERFDSRDVYRLIESYMSAASRRPR